MATLQVPALLMSDPDAVLRWSAAAIGVAVPNSLVLCDRGAALRNIASSAGVTIDPVVSQSSSAAINTVVTQALEKIAVTITSTAFSVAENQTLIGTLTATGGNGGPYTFTKIGGPDAVRFIIGGGNVLNFVVAPDFETPIDSDLNNVYVLQVQVQDTASGTGTATISVTVTNIAIEAVDTWSPSDKGSAVALSNSDMTAQGTDTSNTALRSLRKQTSGKFYWELTRTGGAAGANTGVGIITGAASLANAGPTATSAVVVYTASGNISFNATSTGLSVGAVAAGSVVGFAVDLTNAKFWARVNGGAWNGVGGDNPATNTGGINIAAVFPTAAVRALATFQDANVISTINFGNTAFAQAAPSGFGAWKDASIDATPPVFTSATNISIPENTLLAYVPTANEAVTFTLQPGLDGGLFEFDGTTMRFLGNVTRDFDAPADGNHDNVYTTILRATDAAGNFKDQFINVTVTDVAGAR